jgi:hypothetical protein
LLAGSVGLSLSAYDLVTTRRDLVLGGNTPTCTYNCRKQRLMMLFALICAAWLQWRCGVGQTCARLPLTPRIISRFRRAAGRCARRGAARARVAPAAVLEARLIWHIQKRDARCPTLCTTCKRDGGRTHVACNPPRRRGVRNSVWRKQRFVRLEWRARTGAGGGRRELEARANAIRVTPLPAANKRARRRTGAMATVTSTSVMRAFMMLTRAARRVLVAVRESCRPPLSMRPRPQGPAPES